MTAQPMTAIETADFITYPVEHEISRVEAEARVVRVLWDDGHVSVFHHLWLRDNCPCTDCIHPETREQTFEITSVPETILPRVAEVTGSGALRIVWSVGGHESFYHPGWLRAHCYSDVARAARARAEPKPKTWDASLANDMPSFSGPVVLEDDRALLDWLVTLRDVGAAVLRDTPCEMDTVGRLAARISFPRQTNFGTLFNVRSDLEANSNACTALPLPLHTDLPTRELEPGLQFLHCLVNDAEGGDSLLVDGFRLAECLREEAPELLEVLTTERIDFHNTDPTFDYRRKAPIIALNTDGNPAEIRFGTFLKGPFDLPAEKMELVYRAYRRFSEMTREPRFQAIFRLQPGDLLAFDNRRVLHARTGFDPSTDARHLRGCYIDTDELLSRIRVLQRKFPPAHSW